MGESFRSGAGIGLRLVTCALRGASAPMQEETPILALGEPGTSVSGDRKGHSAKGEPRRHGEQPGL